MSSEWDEALHRLTVNQFQPPRKLALVERHDEGLTEDERRFLIAFGVMFVAGLGMWVGLGYVIWRAVA